MFNADQITQAVNDANARLQAAGFAPWDLAALTTFLARSGAQMQAISADAAADKALADANTAAQAAQANAQTLQSQAATFRDKVLTV